MTVDSIQLLCHVSTGTLLVDRDSVLLPALPALKNTDTPLNEVVLCGSPYNLPRTSSWISAVRFLKHT